AVVAGRLTSARGVPSSPPPQPTSATAKTRRPNRAARTRVKPTSVPSVGRALGSGGGGPGVEPALRGLGRREPPRPLLPVLDRLALGRRRLLVGAPLGREGAGQGDAVALLARPGDLHPLRARVLDLPGRDRDAGIGRRAVGELRGGHELLLPRVQRLVRLRG